MPYKGKRIAVVMPAYKAAKTLVECYEALPDGWFDDVILVDDASPDNTVEVAHSLPIHVHMHPRNRGYGGNQKSCYRLARERGADIAVMIHPDHQYSPEYIPEMVKLMVDDGAQAVFGSRMVNPENARAGGMPWWKFLANKGLTWFGNASLGTQLTEFHSGLRAYDMAVFDEFDIEQNSDNFVFDMQIIIQAADRDMKMAEVPIMTRYFEDASMIGFWASSRYGLGFLKCCVLYRLGLWKA